MIISSHEYHTAAVVVAV